MSHLLQRRCLEDMELVASGESAGATVLTVSGAVAPVDGYRMQRKGGVRMSRPLGGAVRADLEAISFS